MLDFRGTSFIVKAFFPAFTVKETLTFYLPAADLSAIWTIWWGISLFSLKFPVLISPLYVSWILLAATLNLLATASKIQL